MICFKSTLRICLIIVLVIIYIYTVYLKFYKNTAVSLIPNHLYKYLECNVNATVITLGDLWAKVDKVNERREVKHWQQFGPLNPDTTIIVIRAHRDLVRLQYLVISLAQVTNIQTVLLVFSHSFYDDRINYLIQQIDFCMVLQIYYPNSVQLYPDNFPGVDSGDCVNGTRDGYCVERDALVTEMKQHWWWTANFVFDQLFWAAAYKDMVIFIDEDSYVLPDFLYMFRALRNSMNYVSDVSVISFGRHLGTGVEYNKLTVDTWKPSYANGLAFNRSTWRRVSELDKFYCQFDDTSWSYSLMHLFEQFPRGRVVMLTCMMPRVVSTRMFHSRTDALKHIRRIMRTDQLFPQKVQAVMLFSQSGRVLSHYRGPTKGSGGWSDSRDQLLCLEPLFSKATSEDSTTTPPIFTTE